MAIIHHTPTTPVPRHCQVLPHRCLTPDRHSPTQNTFGEDHDYSINPHSYTALGNGIVRDNVTGLEWQQATRPHYSLEQAIDYCNNLSLGGKDDWHLPTVKELATIVDRGRYYPAIDTAYFPDTQTVAITSSTIYYYYILVLTWYGLCLSQAVTFTTLTTTSTAGPTSVQCAGVYQTIILLTMAMVRSPIGPRGLCGSSSTGSSMAILGSRRFPTVRT